MKKLTMKEDHNHGIAGPLRAGGTYEVADSVYDQIVRDFPWKVKGAKSPKTKDVGAAPENRSVGEKKKGKPMSKKGSRWG